MKKLFKRYASFISPGDICLGVIRDEQLNYGGCLYKIPLKPGKYIFTSFGNDSLLLMECTSESSQLLSEVSRGICLSGDPFHIQGYILQPSRIHPQNHTGKKGITRSSLSRRELQALPESRQTRKGDKGCNSSHASKPTTFRYKPEDCNDSHRNNKRNVFQKLVRSWTQLIKKTKKHTGGKNYE